MRAVFAPKGRKKEAATAASFVLQFCHCLNFDQTARGECGDLHA